MKALKGKKVTLLASPANIRQGETWLTVINALAYNVVVITVMY
jgi:hypothetical protein